MNNKLDQDLKKESLDKAAASQESKPDEKDEASSDSTIYVKSSTSEPEKADNVIEGDRDKVNYPNMKTNIPFTIEDQLQLLLSNL